MKKRSQADPPPHVSFTPYSQIFKISISVVEFWDFNFLQNTLQPNPLCILNLRSTENVQMVMVWGDRKFRKRTFSVFSRNRLCFLLDVNKRTAKAWKGEPAVGVVC